MELDQKTKDPSLYKPHYPMEATEARLLYTMFFTCHIHQQTYYLEADLRKWASSLTIRLTNLNATTR